MASTMHTETTATGKDGKPFPCTSWEWERKHGDGPQDGKPVRLLLAGISAEELRILQGLNLLTSKPVLYVCNVEEGSAKDGNSFSEQVFERAKKEGAVAVVISAKIESEIATLSREERAEFLVELHLELSFFRFEIRVDVFNASRLFNKLIICLRQAISS